MVTSAVKKAAPVARKSTTAATKPAGKPAAKTVKKVAAPKKIKVVRDSFSMPQEDYALIAKLKEKAQAADMQVKKSALLRAGLQLLDKSSALQLKRVLSGLTPIKTGRPKKH
ncbi:MAG: hypothetical protein A3J87_01195 [Sideroxydans sp. RIFOXYB12_FULL_59_6]|nr:MAG: hypothetical protein A3J87_01195 [Sideroxydans sp. RIFOXYB12_FULL_59_6]